ncbi:MAG: ispD2 [Hyphomicrobiales bacterium]|nr:ispD2 [Hyphomicrobiales bacterium]
MRIVQGSSENVKITEGLDLVIADELFRMRAASVDPNLKGIDVHGKTAAVFGGSAGIGKAIAQILQDAGCDTQIASRSTGCDVRRYDDVTGFLDGVEARHGRIDFVVNTVGLLSMRNIANQEPVDIAEQIGVNLTGAFNIAKASHRVLAASGGMLLNFSSSSYTRGRAGYVPYSACKAAVVNMTQGLAEEWQGDGVRVNCIVPGRTDTAMRRTNFDNEDQDSLLSPYEVGLVAVKVLSASYSGLVIRI